MAQSSPYIPCWRCGKPLPYHEAVITGGDLAIGYGHAQCSPYEVRRQTRHILRGDLSSATAWAWGGPDGWQAVR